MKTHHLIALAVALAGPAVLLAQDLQVRVVRTNQIPENPAKLIEVVGAREPERSPAETTARREEEVPVRGANSTLLVSPLGAPVLTRHRIENAAELERDRLELEKVHKR